MRKFFVLTLILFSVLPCRPQNALPKPDGFINDYANTLAPDEKEALESLAASIEKETSAEISTAIINSLEGKNLEDYALEIFNGWGVGKKGKDNGVLILVSISDRQMRIEVGYGLESVLPDAVCGRIIRNVMAPQFREGNYYRGIYEAITAMGETIKGEPPASATSNTDSIKFIGFLAVWHAFLILFSFLLFHIAGVIIYFAAVTPLVLTALASENGSQYQAAMGLLAVVPFFIVFFMGMAAPFIFGILSWRLKKKYKKSWKEHIPSYLKKPMSRSGFSGSSRGGGRGGSFGGGSSGGGGASGSW
ncbi:MAG: TPM domain-containing protein [Candidatus Omnitrophica bacterium]|nr:TPM domain-containing protein [Candidatus Omnitrophota bacterium]